MLTRGWNAIEEAANGYSSKKLLHAFAAISKRKTPTSKSSHSAKKPKSTQAIVDHEPQTSEVILGAEEKALPKQSIVVF